MLAKIQEEVVDQVIANITESMVDKVVQGFMQDFQNPAARTELMNQVIVRVNEFISLEKVGDEVATRYIDTEYHEENLIDRATTELMETDWFKDELEEAVVEGIKDSLDTPSIIQKVTKKTVAMVDFDELEKDIVKSITDELKQDFMQEV
jgi:hypothetical protein